MTSTPQNPTDQDEAIEYAKNQKIPDTIGEASRQVIAAYRAGQSSRDEQIERMRNGGVLLADQITALREENNGLKKAHEVLSMHYHDHVEDSFKKLTALEKKSQVLVEAANTHMKACLLAPEDGIRPLQTAEVLCKALAAYRKDGDGK